MSIDTLNHTPFDSADAGSPEPFGGGRMIDVDEATAIGMIACTYAGSDVDDDDSGGQVSRSDDYVAFTAEGMGDPIGDPTSLN